MNNKLIVTLDHTDLINLSEYIHRKNPKNNIGPAYLEYCICKFIKDKKNIDFFKEEEREIQELDKKRNKL